jgi:hypothetical protein
VDERAIIYTNIAQITTSKAAVIKNTFDKTRFTKR